MIDRILIVVTLAVVVALAIGLVRAWSRRRVAALLEAGPVWRALGDEPDGRPTVVAFSSPSCAACHHAQKPALDKLERQVDDLRVIHVDAAERPVVAQAFGVMTVPTTVVLAPSGDVVAVNQGFAPTARLLEQLTAIR